MGALYTLYIQTEGHIQMQDITAEVQRLAQECGEMTTGDPLWLNGRLQSRTYLKNLGEVTQERTAFEISISSLEPVEDVPLSSLL